MANLQSVLDQIKAQIEIKDKVLESVIEESFRAGGAAMATILTIENSNDSEPPQELDGYIKGIAGLTKQVGSFLDSLTPLEVDEYRTNLKEVIVNDDPEVEAALEGFADANLDLTAAVKRMNKRLDELTAAAESEGV